MSLNGLPQFEENLRLVMESDAFKKANDAEKLTIGYRLLKSKYGLGWFANVKKLVKKYAHKNKRG